MRSLPPLPAVTAGLLATFVGFTSTFPVVLKGLTGLGATHAQAASGLMAISIALGVGSIILSSRFRMPVLMAWSTPGAALLAGAGLSTGSFGIGVGTFLVTALLVTAAGVVRPLGRLAASIPGPIANAMLAGILFTLCLAPVKAVAAEPAAGLAIVLAWLVVGRFNRLLAVPVAAIVAILAILIGHDTGLGDASFLPHPVLTMPEFGIAGIVGMAVPLFLVTMASQNIPGLAVLKVNGYEPPAGPIFATTGVLSLLCAPFGGITVNLAAITAAMCAGDEAGPDRSKRWWTGIVSGSAYIVIGLCAGAVTAFASLSPILIEAVAGLSLIGALAAALQGATAVPEERLAASVTFLTTASGIAFFGISAPFWGLLAGTAIHAITPRPKPAVPVPATQAPAPPRATHVPGAL